LRRTLRLPIPRSHSGALALIVGGAKPSTKVAAIFFAFELTLLLVVAIAVLIPCCLHTR